MAVSKYIQSVVKAAGGRPKSTQWFKDKIKEFGQPGATDLIRDGVQSRTPHFGRLNMFFYDPKTKARLPYFDVFPLVLPLETISGGFMGLNFHYLPYMLRFRLLQRLQKFADGGFKSTTKIEANYDDVKSIGLVRPTIKKYLYSNVRSQFLRIDFDEAVLAAYLPVQQFRKAGTSKVWSDSRRMI